MKFKRISRILVCLLLICCLTFHAMIPRAEASSIGAAATIVKASTVTCNPYIIAGATLIALGVYAGVDSGAFETVANNCVSALEAAGTWIKDGAMELLRTEDADGNASYYVDSGLMEDVRSWAIDSSTVTEAMNYTATVGGGSYPLFWSEIPFCMVTFTCTERDTYFIGTFTTQPGTIYNGYEYGQKYSSTTIQANSYGCPCNGYYFRVSYGSGSIPGYAADYLYLGDFSYEQLSRYVYGNSSWSGAARFIANEIGLSFKSSAGVSLGSFPLSSIDLTDGTSARQWSEDYTDRGLKVYGGGSGNNNNDGKWFWPLALTLTAAELYAMSQADQWAAQTPAEFDDYTEVEELEIVSRPEVDFAQGVELAPVTFPDTGGDSGSDTGNESGNQTDYTSWFERIIQGIEELPSKFESWITDCKTAIEELPSKFADWFNNIAEKLERIWEQIQKVGETIVEGIQNVISSLFTPSPDYFTNKVEALKAKHHNIEKFTQLGNDFKLFFTGLGSKPPIIWIDLGAATGSYLWGGKQIFLDLTWYSQYKSKMDFILGAIIWLWLAWRVFLSVPGIINGASGVWGKYHRGGSRDDN